MKKVPNWEMYSDLTMSQIEERTKKIREFARSKHPKFTTWYEVYGCLMEEMDEFWESLKKDNPDPIELLGLAATAQLAIVEMCNKNKD